MNVDELIKYIKENNLEDKRIFLSGAITSRLNTYKEHFGRIAKKLDENDLSYYNPATIDISTSWKDSMRMTIRELLDSDIVYLLEGYEVSKGVKQEIEIAKALGIEIIKEK